MRNNLATQHEDTQSNYAKTEWNPQTDQVMARGTYSPEAERTGQKHAQSRTQTRSMEGPSPAHHWEKDTAAASKELEEVLIHTGKKIYPSTSYIYKCP